jgi:hypothetical protein
MNKSRSRNLELNVIKRPHNTYQHEIRPCLWRVLSSVEDYAYERATFGKRVRTSLFKYNKCQVKLWVDAAAACEVIMRAVETRCLRVCCVRSDGAMFMVIIRQLQLNPCRACRGLLARLRIIDGMTRVAAKKFTGLTYAHIHPPPTIATPQ